MTQSVLTNSNNDIYKDANGNLAIGFGLAAVKQACFNVAKASLGEEVFATGNGMPFFQAVFVGVPNLQMYQQYLRAGWLTVPGVAQIQSLTMTVQNNTLSYTAVIETIYGTTFTLQQEFPLS